jgi:hypothetical protein
VWYSELVWTESLAAAWKKRPHYQRFSEQCSYHADLTMLAEVQKSYMHNCFLNIYLQEDIVSLTVVGPSD